MVSWARGLPLWRIPDPLGGAYQGYTPAISGDILVAVANNGLPRSEHHMFMAGYRLSPQGAERIWRFPDGSACTYMCPVIHRERVYIHTGASPDFLPEGYEGPQPSGEAIVCVDLSTGVIMGIAVFGTENRQGAGPFVMDGRLFVYGRHMYDAQPGPDGTLKRLDLIKPQAITCTFPTGAAGFLYLRPMDESSLVQYWDLRRIAHGGLWRVMLNGGP